MRKIALLTAVVAATMAFANVSSASAISWTPQNQNISLYQYIPVEFISPVGERINECPYVSGWNATASGAVLKWTNQYQNTCRKNGFVPVAVTTLGQWSETATSTSTVTLKADTVPSGGPVLRLELEGCKVTVNGPVSIPGVPFDNATHRLTLNNALPTAVATGAPAWCTQVYNGSWTIKGTIGHNVATILP